MLSLLLCVASAAHAQHDLSLFRVSSDVFVDQGDIVSFTFVVTNDLGTDVDGVTVQIDMPAGLTYLQHTLSQTFDPVTGVWDVGSIAHYQPQRVLTIDARVAGEGVLIANAEVATMTGTDVDSAPGNGALAEDDITSACVSVPIRAECGQSVLLEAPAGYSGYQWYKEGNPIAGATAATLNVAESGQYNFQVGDLTATCPLGSCCPAVVTFDSVSVSLSQPLVCTGGFDTVFVSMPEVDTINFATTYAWMSPDDPALDYLGCADCPDPTIVIDGTYLNDSIRYVVNVVTRDPGGAVVCSANATITVEVLQAPLIQFAVPAYACAETSYQLEITTDLPTASVAWDGPNLRTPDGYVMTYVPRTVSDYTTESFVVTAIGLDGCQRVDSVQITTVPALDVDVVADTELCQFEAAELAVSTQPALPADSVAVVWSEAATNPNAGANLPSTTALSLTTAPLQPGVYGFSVSVMRVTPDGGTVCAYLEDVTVTVDDDCAQPRLGGYAWKDASGDGFRQNFEAPLAGVTTELFTSAGVNTGLTATTDASGFYEYTDLAVGDYYVQFQPLPGFVFAPQNQGTDEFTDSDVDATGRSDDFATTYDEAVHLIGAGYVQDCQLALTNINATPADCGEQDGTLEFTVFGGSGQFTYTWVPDVSMGATADQLTAGTYEVTVYDEFTECSLTQTLTVPGSSNYLLSASSTPAACPMGKGGAITLFTDGGSAPFTVTYAGTDAGTLTAGAMPFTIADVRGGQYVIEVTDAAGCTQTTGVQVTENPLLLTLDTANVVIAGCNGAASGSFDVEVGGFFGTYTMRINGLTVASGTSQPVVSLTGQAAGRKDIEITDENGCVQVFTFVLLDGSAPIDLAALAITNADCYGAATGRIASSTGAAYEVRDVAGQLVGTLPQNALPAGEYTLVDRSTPGCISTAVVTIAEPDELLAEATVRGSDCDVDNGAIELLVAGGTAPYRYVWSGGLPDAANQDGLAAGNYVVGVTDAQGCRTDLVIAVPDLCAPAECPDVFTADTLIVETLAAATDLCIPNFDVLSDEAFTLDGAAVSTTVCVRSALVYYNLDALPGDGADGPYIVEFWYGGEQLVNGAIVADQVELAAALDAADDWGRWRYDAAENNVRGGQPDRAYGELEITHVGSGQRVYLTTNRLRSQLSASVALASPGTYTLAAANGTTGCTDSMVVVVQAPDACADAFVPASTTLATPYCDAPTPVCVDVPYELYLRGTLRVDGVAYTGPASPCRVEEVVYYDVSAFAKTDDLYVDAWTVDGRFESARASSLAEVAARMSAFDTEPWRYDATLGVLRGGAAARAYGALELRGSTGTQTLAPQTTLYDGTSIELLAGAYELSIEDEDGCTGSGALVVRCSSDAPPTVDTLYAEVGVGYADTLCIGTEELAGALDFTSNLCAEASGEQVVVTMIDSLCFRYEGFELGTDTVCFVACDVNGVCDTTIVVIEAVDPLEYLYPIANRDTLRLDMNGQRELAILTNDEARGEITSLEVVAYPRRGDASIEGELLVYVADPFYCGVDSLVYELCNAYGCDTAIVDVTVECDELIIFSGFSPNFDDVNETFTVLGIEQYPGNRMEVFNRFGNKVFEMDEYDNSWEGTYFDGEELPQGTYYYIFEDGRGRTYTGYVYIRR